MGFEFVDLTTIRACIGDGYCDGSQVCTDSDCEPCECRDTGDVRFLWSSDLRGSEILELAAREDANLVVALMDTAPWLATFSFEEGTRKDVSPQEDIGWARRLHVDERGKIWVAGLVPPGTGGFDLRLMRFSQQGVLEASHRIPGVSVVIGFADSDDGQAHLAYLAGSTLTVALPADDLQVVFEEELAAPCDGAPNAFALGPTGLPIVGWSGDCAQLIFSNPDSAAKRIDLSGSESDLAIAVDGTDVFVSVGTGGQSQTTGFGGIGIEISKHDAASGVQDWSWDTVLDPATFYPNDFYRRTQTLLLSDSVLLGVTEIRVEEGQPELEYVTRFSKDGTRISGTIAGIGRVVGAEVAGPNAAAFAWRTPHGDVLSVAKFPSAAGAVPDGASCRSDQVCSSRRCCLTSSTGAGTCSSVACPAGSECSQNSDCNESICLGASQAQMGICTARCVASADCARNHYCVSQQCVSVCNQSACSASATQCVEAKNAEDVVVPVCLPPSAE